MYRFVVVMLFKVISPTSLIRISSVAHRLIVRVRHQNVYVKNVVMSFMYFSRHKFGNDFLSVQIFYVDFSVFRTYSAIMTMKCYFLAT